MAHPLPTWKLPFDTLGRGENLRNILVRRGLSDSLAAAALAAATSLDRKSVRVGLPVTVRSETRDSVPSEVIVQLADDRFLHLKHDSTGWSESTEQLDWAVDTIVITGTIHSNLYRAMDEAAGTRLSPAARTHLVVAIADSIYQYKVDMTRDLHPDDTFRVAAERRSLASGVVRIGKVIASSLSLSRRELTAVRFNAPDAPESARGEYFDEKGNSMRGAFLHKPVEFRYITSRFGMRLHPILGIMRMHQGMDYSAASGTPVQSVGDGVVTSAGWSDGYGNLIEIRHPNGMITRYGHLRDFAKGIHEGARVSVGDVIGHVGMTGLATAPHLHFETIMGGKQRNPAVALMSAPGDPVAPSQRFAFDLVRARAVASLTAGANLASVAQP